MKSARKTWPRKKNRKRKDNASWIKARHHPVTTQTSLLMRQRPRMRKRPNKSGGSLDGQSGNRLVRQINKLYQAHLQSAMNGYRFNPGFHHRHDAETTVPALCCCNHCQRHLSAHTARIKHSGHIIVTKSKFLEAAIKPLSAKLIATVK